MIDWDKIAPPRPHRSLIGTTAYTAFDYPFHQPVEDVGRYLRRHRDVTILQTHCPVCEGNLEAVILAGPRFYRKELH